MSISIFTFDNDDGDESGIMQYSLFESKVKKNRNPTKYNTTSTTITEYFSQTKPFHCEFDRGFNICSVVSNP